MSHAAVSFRLPTLAWNRASHDERRFQRIARRVLLAVAVPSLLLPLMPLRAPDRPGIEPLPAPMARLLLRESAVSPQALLRNTPPIDATPPPRQPERASPPSRLPEAPPRPAAEVGVTQPLPALPAAEAARQTARRKAASVGLLALSDELQQVSGAALAVQLRDDIRPGPGLGSSQGPGTGAGAAAGLPVRALITGQAAQGSGGVDTAAYSRHSGGGGLAGRATTLVDGAAGDGRGGAGAPGGSGTGKGTGSGTSDSPGAQAQARGGSLHKGGSGRASRSIEDIKLVFERHKGAIYALYNRALRDAPALQGKLVLELRIAPGGQVEGLRIVSSELGADELERKLLARIRQFDFGAKDVDVMVVTWPVDFLPS